MDDWVEIGVFANAAGARSATRRCCTCSAITSPGRPKITVMVDAKPDEAGFDPYNKLIDRVPSDNRTQVSVRQTGSDPR